MQNLFSCKSVIKAIPSEKLKPIIESIIHELLKKYGKEAIEKLIFQEKKKVMYQEVIFDTINLASSNYINTYIMIELAKNNIGEFKLQLNGEECNKLIFYFNNGLSSLNKQYFTDLFHEILEENKYTDSYDFESIDDLKEKDIKIGQTVTSSPTFTVDSNYRDCPFAIIDSKLYKGTKSEHHADLVNKYLTEHGYDFDTDYDQQNFSDAIIDQDEDNSGKTLDPNTSVSFGHIWNNIGFVDFTFGDETYKTTSDKLKSELNLDRVFSHDYYSREFTRLAKHISDDNIILECLPILDKYLRKNLLNNDFKAGFNTINETLDMSKIFNIIESDNILMERLSDKIQSLFNESLDEEQIDYYISIILSSYQFTCLYNKYITILNTNNRKKLEDPLLNNNDKVGDSIDIDFEDYVLDVGGRERPFIIINDKAYIGEYAVTHAMILHHITNDKKYEYFRPSLKDIGENKLAFGNITGKIAWLDLRSNELYNYTISDKSKLAEIIIKEYPSIEKVYAMPESKRSERLASKAPNLLQITQSICLSIVEDMFKNKYFEEYIGYDKPTIDTTSMLNSEEIIKSIFNNSYFQSEFKKIATQKANELNIDFNDLYCWINESLHTPEFYLLYNKYLTQLNENNRQLLEEELLNNNDKVGDYIDIDWRNLDIGYREKPFVIIDNKLYIGDTGSTHGLLVNKILNNNSFGYYRPDFSKLSKSIAIGHIVNSIAFIDDDYLYGEYSDNDLLQLGNLVKSQSNIKKVYTIPNSGTIERLAKKVNR